MAGKVKTWVWVVLGVIVACVVGVVGVAGAGFYFFSRHIETRTVVGRGGQPGVRRGQGAGSPGRSRSSSSIATAVSCGRTRTGPPPATAAVPEELHVMAFDPDDGRVVRRDDPVLAAAFEDTAAATSTSTATDGPRRPQAAASRTSSASARRSSSTTTEHEEIVSSSGRSNCPLRAKRRPSFTPFSAVSTPRSRRESCDSPPHDVPEDQHETILPRPGARRRGVRACRLRSMRSSSAAWL